MAVIHALDLLQGFSFGFCTHLKPLGDVTVLLWCPLALIFRLVCIAMSAFTAFQ